MLQHSTNNFELIESKAEHGLKRSDYPKTFRNLTVLEVSDNYPLWYDMTGDIAELETISLCVNE